MVEHIDEDAPRLIYADWLEENGQLERAEFVRVQVERARLPAWDAAQVRLRIREQRLLEMYGESWLAEMPGIEGARWEGFRRGVVAEVSFKSFEAMRKHAEACRAVAPVEAVTVRWPRRRDGEGPGKPVAELRELTFTGRPDYETFRWVAESPQLATLRILTIRGLWGDALAWLVASPHLAGLRALRLPSNNLGNYGLRALAKSTTLTALEELNYSSVSRHERYIHDPVLRAATMTALMSWPGMATVRSLNLNGNDLEWDGLRSLLRSPHAASLKELSLRDCNLDGQAMAEFASAVSGLRLQALDVGDNVLKDVGAEYLAVVRCLGELKSLNLDRCEITLAGARQFVKKASFLGELRQLDVGHNHFGAAALDALLERAPTALHTLRLRDSDLWDREVQLLAGSAASNALLEVDLSQNDLGADATLALGESEQLRALLVLRVAENPLITEPVAAVLAASPLGKRLAVLELDPPLAVTDPPQDDEDDDDPEPGYTPPPPAHPLPPVGGDDIPF
jgi:uncharacterized protein (TIGR02996 family)